MPRTRAPNFDLQRAAVEALAQPIGALEPRLRRELPRMPLTMMLVGMINWTFTWLRADGPLSCDDTAEVVIEVFLRGIADASAEERAAA